MAAQPSMIKRPVLDLGGKLLVGFKPDIYARDVASKSRGRKAELAELEHVACRNAAGGTMKEIAVDDAAQPWHRQLVVSTHQVLISKPPSSLMVFSDAMMWVTPSPSENGNSSRS